MACTRQCIACGEWIDWQDTVEPYDLQPHIRVTLVGTGEHFPADERPTGWACSPGCLSEFVSEHADAFDWGETTDLER